MVIETERDKALAYIGLSRPLARLVVAGPQAVGKALGF